MFKKKNQKLSERDRTPARLRQPTVERSVGTSVFSYHANRSVRPGASRHQEVPEAAPAARAKRNFRFNLFKRGRVAIVLLLATAALIVNLFLSHTPSLTVISTAKNEVFLQDRSVYQTAATQALRSSVWNGNKLTINTAGIERSLRNSFPELQYVRVSVPFAGNTIRIYAEPAMPQLLLSSGNTVYILDGNGRAVIKANDVAHIEKIGLPVVTDESNLPIETGKAVLPSTSVAFITEVVAQLKAAKVPVSSLTLPASSSELDVRITGLPYFVKYNLRGSAREEAGTYLAVKGQLERDKKTPSTYIDVRVEERAYYR
jgi:hypothetical protein